MFTINTPEGPIDIDDSEVRQECYNKMMNKKEKTGMFQLEVDFIMLGIEFKTLAQIKPWVQIALSTGAWMVAIWCNDKLIEVYE